MMSDKDSGRFLASIFIGIGILMLIVYGFDAVRVQNLYSGGTETWATVIGITHHKYSTSYQIRFHTLDNGPVKADADIEAGIAHEVGDMIEIIYDENNPSDAVEKGGKANSDTLVVGGLLLVLSLSLCVFSSK